MSDSLRDVIDEPWHSVDDVLDSLVTLEHLFAEDWDDRGIFVTAYRRMTRGIALQLDGSFFDDPGWVRTYLVAFGEYYRRALLDWERGRTDRMADAWVLAFEAAGEEDALVLQDLVLGVNAHINHDLPFALDEAGLDEHRDQKYGDHDRVNRVIRGVLDTVQRRISEYYSNAVGHLDRLLGRVDETVTQFSLEKARDHAWSNGVALTASPDERERRRLEERIDDSAESIARVVLAPTELPAFLVEALEYVDGSRDEWWFGGVAETLPDAESILDSDD